VQRRFVSFVLAIGLLLAQQAALAHAISHLGAPAGGQTVVKTVQADVDTQQEVSDFCADCLAFAQLAAGATCDVGIDAVVALPVLIDVASSEGRHCSLLVSFLARAPPVVL